MIKDVDFEKRFIRAPVVYERRVQRVLATDNFFGFLAIRRNVL